MFDIVVTLSVPHYPSHERLLKVDAPHAHAISMKHPTIANGTMRLHFHDSIVEMRTNGCLLCVWPSDAYIPIHVFFDDSIHYWDLSR